MYTEVKCNSIHHVGIFKKWYVVIRDGEMENHFLKIAPKWNCPDSNHFRKIFFNFLRLLSMLLDPYFSFGNNPYIERRILFCLPNQRTSFIITKYCYQMYVIWLQVIYFILFLLYFYSWYYYKCLLPQTLCPPPLSTPSPFSMVITPLACVYRLCI